MRDNETRSPVVSPSGGEKARERRASGPGIAIRRGTARRLGLHEAREDASRRLVEKLRARPALPPARVRRAIREAAGVSQRDLGKELGVSGMAVSRWEDGSRSPSGDTAARYGQLLISLREITLGGEA